MESTFKCARRATRTRSSLLGYLRPSSDMADGPFFLILSLLLGWCSRQLDFVTAYPQAPAEMPLYLRLPQGYKRKGMKRNSHVLKLKCNVYGQKQAGRVWNQYMDQGMKSIGFTHSKFDPCLYYRKSIVFLVCIDDCIVFGPNDKAID